MGKEKNNEDNGVITKRWNLLTSSRTLLPSGLRLIGVIKYSALESLLRLFSLLQQKITYNPTNIERLSQVISKTAEKFS